MEHTDTNPPEEEPQKESQEESQEAPQQEPQQAPQEESRQALGGQQALLPYALKQGFSLGLLNVSISAIAYALGPEVMAHWGIQWGLFLFNFVFITYMGLRFRSAPAHPFSFGRAWQYSFVAFCGLSALSLLWGLLLHTVIDPELKEGILDKASEGAPEATAEAIRAFTGFFYTPLGMLVSTIFALGLYALLSLLSGLFIRRKTPEQT